MITFKDDDANFLKWTRENANGFVLAIRKRREGMRHAADCADLTESFGASTAMTRKLKLCALDSSELGKWASDNDVQVTICADC